MNSKEYWQNRGELTQARLMQKADNFADDMEKAYKAAIESIEKDISVFFQRFAKNEGMTLAKANKLLKAGELERFKMTVEEYIQKGIENSVSEKWLKELESASDLYRISRLKALNIQIQQQIELIAAYKEQGLSKTLQEIFEEGYYRNIFDFQQFTGVGSAFAALDNKAINAAISKPWTYDGETFSERIWKDRDKLKYSLEKILTQGIIRGDSPDKTAKLISKETGTELRAARRLVLTESAAIAEMASLESYKELCVDEIEILVTLDEKTCGTCGPLDGRHFPRSESSIGINVPPFHPNCRCTTVPYFDDEFTAGTERAARDKDGKTYYVPRDMTFEEWKRKYVDKNINVPDYSDNKNFNENDFTEERFRTRINDILDRSNGNETHIFNMKFYAETTEYVRNDTISSPFAYLPKDDVIAYNPTNPYIKYYDMDYVEVHELTHRMDILQYHSWENEKFKTAIEASRKKVYDNFENLQELFAEGGKYDGEAALSDIMSALTNNEMSLAIGHEEWGRISNEVEMEIFANISSIDVLNLKYNNDIEYVLKDIREAYREAVE